MRSDDKADKTYFRSQRVFYTNGQWHFCTREGEHGPFPSRLRAQTALSRFVNEKVELDHFQKSRAEKLATLPHPRVGELELLIEAGRPGEKLIF